jgi:rsbT co-antagonist protein RsbR
MHNPSSRQPLAIEAFPHLLAGLPLEVWSVDADGNCTASDGKSGLALGSSGGAVVGSSALERLRDRPEAVNALVRALSGQRARVVTSPAPGVQVECWFEPVRGPAGEVLGAACMSLDVSERAGDGGAPAGSLARDGSAARTATTPIIQVWDGVLCLPVIGTVDSERTAEMMQGLLESIVREQARYAIVDLTGVEIVDTSTADHLIQLFRAARVLGVEGVLCGIRPAVAQTIVGLGLDLGSVRTARSLRDALKWCIRGGSAAASREARAARK